MPEEPYREINIIDGMRTILRRKRLIATVTAATILITAVFLFGMPNRPLYETSGDIQIGQVDDNLIETKDRTNAFLRTEATAQVILKQLDPAIVYTKPRIQNLLNNITIDGSVNAEKQKETPDNLLRASFRDSNPTLAVRVVEILLNLVIERHQKLFDSQQKVSSALLAQKQTQLNRAKENLQRVEKRTDDLFNLRYPASYAPAQGYASTSYISTQDNLRAQINALEEDLLTKKITQGHSLMSAIISPPLTPTNTVSSATKTSILLIVAAILGAFLGTLAALIAEWWEKNSSQIIA